MLMGGELRRGHIPEAGVEPFGVVKGNEPPTMLAGFIQIGVILSIDLFQGFEEEFPFARRASRGNRVKPDAGLDDFPPEEDDLPF